MNDEKLILSCKIPYGKKAVIRKFVGDIYHITRLREIGFGEGMTISKMSDDAHRCVIINLKGRKICLNEAAAHTILVELLNEK